MNKKDCSNCGRPMHRKMRGRRLESDLEFERRRFCCVPCKTRGGDWKEADRLAREALAALRAQIQPYDDHVRACGNAGRRWLWGRRAGV